MKIRIKGNSIRIRLSKSEVDRFGELGWLEEKTEFGQNSFGYALGVKKDISDLDASFDGNSIVMWVPENIQKEWTSTDRVGFEFKKPLADGKSLFLLLEKDFVCLDNTFEDQSDNYPNPNAVC